MSIQLTEKEKEILHMCLNMRICYIETGDVVLRAYDAAQQKKPFEALSTDQMRAIIETEDLIKKLYKYSFVAAEMAELGYDVNTSEKKIH